MIGYDFQMGEISKLTIGPVGAALNPLNRVNLRDPTKCDIFEIFQNHDVEQDGKTSISVEKNVVEERPNLSQKGGGHLHRHLLCLCKLLLSIFFP